MNNHKLKALLTIKNGKDHKALDAGNIPVFGSGGLMRYVNQFIYDEESILLPRKGSLDNIQYADKPFWTVDTLYYTVVNKEKVNAYYLYNYLKQLDLSSLNSGTGVPSMTFGAYYDINVKLPALDIQQKIASVLSSLDAKIEINNRINTELEQMAKTLYDYWFVQFDFPNEQDKPYKSSGGKMVYNPELKREIPEGWEVKSLANWIEADKGGDWGKESEQGNYTSKVNCIRGADINGLNGRGALKSPIRYILEKNETKILEPNDLIVEISGGSPTQSTGRLAYITDGALERFENPIICSNFCKALSLKDSKQLYYFAYYWNLIYDNDILFGWEGKTSGIKNLLFDSFVNHYKIPQPEDSFVAKFNAFVGPLEKMKQKNLQQNQQLAALRDWLLPMLMNGQVTVKEAEEKVSELGVAAEPEVKYKS
ncbi:restriction endonuclease subunit S [uncultured Draconibacterium sp.]|uniref:restriction endonuclease subunit S n=1 Tax=uncultured Draconibacterium sp. TaxID=1573823 RepID=UPI002AA81EFF|nr:restriction endonuclease subunit S [uncultured Draconibacterium sp.]